MPYTMPGDPRCGVIHQPSGKLADQDGGYVASEDCSVVYVLPPKSGEIRMSTPVFDEAPMIYCPGILELRKKLNVVMAQSTGTLSDWMNILRQIKEFEAAVRDLYPGVAGMAAGSASFSWNEMIRAYREANPWSAASFVAMPIRAGALTLTEGETHGANQAGSSDDSRPLKTDMSWWIEAAGLQLPEHPSTTENAPLPEVYRQLYGKNSVIMGQSVGLQMSFGLIGACGMINHEAGDYRNALSATYTFVYPVQTKAVVEIRVKRQSIRDLASKFIGESRSKGAGFRFDDFKNSLESKGVLVDVVINTGETSGTADQFIKDFQSDVTRQFYQTILGAIQNQGAISILGSQSVSSQNHHSEECTYRGPFHLFRHCEDRTYTTTSTQVDWDKAFRDLDSSILAPAASGTKYWTFYAQNTRTVNFVKDGGAK